MEIEADEEEDGLSSRLQMVVRDVNIDWTCLTGGPRCSSFPPQHRLILPTTLVVHHTRNHTRYTVEYQSQHHT